MSRRALAQELRSDHPSQPETYGDAGHPNFDLGKALYFQCNAAAEYPLTRKPVLTSFHRMTPLL